MWPVPNASERGATSYGAHKWAARLPPGGFPLQDGGQILNWPRRGPVGYIIPTVWIVPKALERGTTSEVDRKGA